MGSGGRCHRLHTQPARAPPLCHVARAPSHLRADVAEGQRCVVLVDDGRRDLCVVVGCVFWGGGVSRCVTLLKGGVCRSALRLCS
jgi:hypothetical protein